MSKGLVHQGYIGKGPVRYIVHRSGQPNSSEVSISVDYTEVPVPQLYYVADFFEVHDLGTSVLLVFGKRDGPQTSRLRTKLEVYFPINLFVAQLWASSRVFHKSLQEELAQQDLASPSLPSIGDDGAEKVQTIQANNVLIARTGWEAVLDFYILSAREIALKTRKKKPVALEPLARINFISLTLLLEFLNECDRVAEPLATKFPQPQEETV